MKYIIGAAVVVVLALAVWGVWWLIQDENHTCAHYANVVTAVGQHDPQDLHGVVEMYNDACS